ncbi:MAG: ATP-binding cassette domain-containing protein [Thermoanaerobaculia bacterium]|nr:ATP-binding cassette domain-containing protein [Thermoanaerobaculia bacterium]
MTEPRSRPVLQVRDLRVSAGDRCILGGTSLSLRPGEIVALTGPSGVGKSTLLRSINRLQELRPGMTVSGSVCLHDLEVYAPSTDPDQVRRRIGFLFQRPVVFPTTLRRNLTLALGPAGLPRHDWEARLEVSLRRAALWSEVRDRLDDNATHLSLGQQQRLCLARALAVEPEVLLLDEPTSALDPEATAILENGLRELATSVPILIVTHDPSQAERLAHRDLRLLGGSAGATLADLCRSPLTSNRPRLAPHQPRAVALES